MEAGKKDTVGVARVQWADILSHWARVECDLHERFQIDVESGVLARRSWRWLRVRIEDLINQNSRLRAELQLTSETTA